MKVTTTQTVTGATSGTAMTTGSETHRKVNIYNVLGELVETVDGAGVTGTAAMTDKVTTEYTYDASGLADTVTVNDMETVFDHDAAGNRSRVVHPDFGTVSFAYTALGELRERSEGTGTAVRDTTYAYDRLGRLTKRKDPDGVAEWVYDPTGAKGALKSRYYHDSVTATASPRFERLTRTVVGAPTSTPRRARRCCRRTITPGKATGFFRAGSAIACRRTPRRKRSAKPNDVVLDRLAQPAAPDPVQRLGLEVVLFPT